MPQQIKFGTDGWRGLIADDYTFENVRRVAHAMAHYVHKHEDASKGVFIAYDTRFGSRRFAEAAAEAIASTGLHVRLANDYTPTPALSYCIKKYGAAGGVMITSSHNPANWNGVKYKAQLRWIGYAHDHETDRELPRCATDPKERRQSRSLRFQEAVHRGLEELCGSRRHRQGEFQVLH